MARRDGAHILHADLDAFYASVVLLAQPSLRGKPVAVGGGVVLSCTYEARAFGVRGGMPLRQARRLCPDLIVVHGEFGAYTAYSERVLAIFRDFTPLVEPISIDEAFLDVSGAGALFGTPEAIARSIRARVRSETGLPVSIGVAPTKHLAKVASRVAKPDGLVVVPPGTEDRFLRPLSVDHLWGVGPVTQAKLAELGIATVGQLADVPYRTAAGRLGGAAAAHLHALANNHDPRAVEVGRRARSVGAQSAFARDERDPERWRTVLMGLAERVGGRLRAKGRAGRTITARIRFSDFESITRAHTLLAATASTTVLHRVAASLVDDAMAGESARGVSLLGISVSKLCPASPLQLPLPLAEPGVVGSERQLQLDRLDAGFDGVRDRFGKEAIGRAAVLLDPRRSRFAEGLSEIMAKD